MLCIELVVSAYPHDSLKRNWSLACPVSVADHHLTFGWMWLQPNSGPTDMTLRRISLSSTTVPCGLRIWQRAPTIRQTPSLNPKAYTYPALSESPEPHCTIAFLSF